MIQKAIGVLLFVVGLVLVLIFNGNILSKQLAIPPLGKLLNPYQGVWSQLDEDRKVILEGKNGQIEILIDDRGVPHIYANALEDALYGQGYIEARDRTFQMQFIRKVATGQLSSYFGERTLSFDKWTHKKGIPSAVKIAAEKWERDADVALTHDAYIDGANAYLKNLSFGQYPLEMKLLSLEPELWDIEAAASVFKYMGNNLAGGNDDIESNNVRILLGDEMYHKYYREVETVEEPIIPYEVKYDFDVSGNTAESPDRLYDQPLYKAYYEKRNKNIGSNNWVVGNEKSATGSPILCSDPHLSLSIPSIWYEVNIITPEVDVYGVSFPGLPGIMIGFNQDIAWGETNVGHDVQDLYHINYTNDSRTHYWLDGKETAITYRYDTIDVKGIGTVVDTNRLTYWGPIIKESNDGKTDIAMDWLVARPAAAAEGNTFVNAMQCKNYDCFKEMTNAFVTPAQNFLYAHKQGDIALRVNGLLPARTQDDGRFVAEGDSTKYGWNHWIPRAQNPQAINPSQGYLTSSNQRSASPNYPYYYTGNFEKYRNRAINDHLDTTNQVSANDMKAFQNNTFSKFAEDFVPLFMDLINEKEVTADQRKAIEILSNWNYEYSADSPAPALFEKWYREVRNNTWDEIAVYRDTMAVEYPSSIVLRDLLREQPDDQIFDRLYTIEEERAADIVKLGLDSMTNYMARHDDEYLLWGNRNRVRIPHLARVPGLGVDKLHAGGSGDVINATSGSFGPSWRMVVGLGDEVDAYGIYPGGQSGDPRSSNYRNMVEKWRVGEYDKLIYGMDKTKILGQ